MLFLYIFLLDIKRFYKDVTVTQSEGMYKILQIYKDSTDYRMICVMYLHTICLNLYYYFTNLNTYIYISWIILLTVLLCHCHSFRWRKIWPFFNKITLVVETNFQIVMANLKLSVSTTES